MESDSVVIVVMNGIAFGCAISSYLRGFALQKQIDDLQKKLERDSPAKEEKDGD